MQAIVFIDFLLFAHFLINRAKPRWHLSRLPLNNLVHKSHHTRDKPCKSLIFNERSQAAQKKGTSPGGCGAAAWRHATEQLPQDLPPYRLDKHVDKPAQTSNLFAKSLISNNLAKIA
ncbi:hypothetical protein [Delftia sp. PS-11]|uniref:hypothetical protein n=1 Tax=Delftia sp. PS-11 TaxID=2767222 RepID=UPI002453F8F7|nr:hypothetical protein [Delftia sp. PS-11]KAJ8744010.1 hypothetical protein H9T68_14400 [Delftia sp. PS-11]